MRIPLTPHGLPEMLLFTALLGGAGAAGVLWVPSPVGPVAAFLAGATWLFVTLSACLPPVRVAPEMWTSEES